MNNLSITIADRWHLEGHFDTLDYSSLKSLGAVSTLNVRSAEELIASNFDTNVLITGKLELSDAIIGKIPSLKLIIKAGVGCEKINIVAANKRGITVANLPGYGTEIVAQSTLAMILALSSSLYRYDNQVKQGKWVQSQYAFPIISLHGKTLGIAGLGLIGKALLRLVEPFGMKLIVHTRYPDYSLQVEYVGLEELAQRSDVLSLHNTLTSTNRGMINEKFLSKMRSTALIVNTARSALIDEQAIVNALESKRIAGLALDGFWREPAESDHPLFKMDNVIITPHSAWAARSVRQDMIHKIARVVESFMNGKIINEVSP